MLEFFEKYEVALNEMNAIECIVDHAKKVKKAFMKNKEKGYKELAEQKVMIEDFFEASDIDIKQYL